MSSNVERIYNEVDYKGSMNLKKIERNLMIDAIIKSNGNALQASNLLKMSIRTYYRKLINHSMSVKDGKIIIIIR